MVVGISHDIAFGMCQMGDKGIPHDCLVCFLTMWYAFFDRVVCFLKSDKTYI